MNTVPCDLSECTIAVTGACLQSFAPGQCPHRTSQQKEGPVDDQKSDVDEANEGAVGSLVSLDLGAPVLGRPEEMPRLPASGTLGLDRANRLICECRANVVGVVGLPDAGKTACLASIYLLLAKGHLKGFAYANSDTLMAFEEIARGTRRWNDGNPPAQMTNHTQMAQDREAGFLHLRLLRKADHRMLDLLVPDLPGEWSDALIDRNDTARFNFLKSVSVIWMMVDGRRFINMEELNFAMYRTKCLIERLAAFLPDPKPKIILVPSWRDLGAIPSDVFDRLKADGARWGLEISMISIASFSENDDVPPGEGLTELIETTLSSDPSLPDFWPDEVSPKSMRSLLKFRG